MTGYYLEAIINPWFETNYHRHSTVYESLEEVRGKCRILGLVHPGCKTRIIGKKGDSEKIIEEKEWLL